MEKYGPTRGRFLPTHVEPFFHFQNSVGDCKHVRACLYICPYYSTNAHISRAHTHTQRGWIPAHIYLIPSSKLIQILSDDQFPPKKLVIFKVSIYRRVYASITLNNTYRCTLRHQPWLGNRQGTTIVSSSRHWHASSRITWRCPRELLVLNCEKSREFSGINGLV